jgi:hypothetical protein
VPGKAKELACSEAPRVRYRADIVAVAAAE